MSLFSSIVNDFLLKADKTLWQVLKKLRPCTYRDPNQYEVEVEGLKGTDLSTRLANFFVENSIRRDEKAVKTMMLEKKIFESYNNSELWSNDDIFVNMETKSSVAVNCDFDFSEYPKFCVMYWKILC